MNGKVSLRFAWLLVVVTAWSLPVSASETLQGEVLYNGIRLPTVWPPVGPLTREPRPAPYLQQPPEMIPIDVGRQLLVDDFLVQETTLQRVFHRPEYHPANPMLQPDKPWDKQGKASAAMVFSDGVWWEPSLQRFGMWYMGGLFSSTCYAQSADGVHWEKPALDVDPGTGVVLKGARDSSTVWLDHDERDPQRRYKMLTAAVHPEKKFWHLVLRTSPDGIHWSGPLARSPRCGDRSTFFYNPFRRVWVLSLRNEGTPRARNYREHRDLVEALKWADGDVVPWIGADRLDPHHPDPQYQGVEPQLYNLDGVAYESLLLGLFSIWQGPENGTCATLKIQKRNEVLLGFSRDGFHWHRPDRRPFLQVNPVKDAWNWGNVQSAGGGCLVVGDKLYFYFSGRALCSQFWDGSANTGLAVLRRDGFASLDAGATPGVLTTRPVCFHGKRLFVNASVDRGELTVEILDRQGQAIAPFTRANCLPLTLDKTLAEVKFRGVDDLSPLAGQPVGLRFHLRNGSLYSFWVSPDASGASQGYVAAGGPGFAGAVDTSGTAAYVAAEKIVRAGGVKEPQTSGNTAVIPVAQHGDRSRDTAPVENTALVPLPKLENDCYDWYARHAAVLDIKDQLNPEIVMIGDSITHFWAGVPQGPRQNGPQSWKELFGDRRVLNLGFGWDRTQNVLWRLDHAEFDILHPRCVVINIGTNNFSGTSHARANTPAEVAEAIRAICIRIRSKSPESRIIIMGVLPRGAKATDPFRAKIAELNRCLPELAKALGITFLDIGEKFLGAGGELPRTLMGDFCHPTEAGYAIWAAALKPLL
jgi:lysophospholipase L1-like esterase